MTIPSRIDVALGCDNAYLPHAAAVIASVARTTRTSPLRFIVMHSQVPKTRRWMVQAAAPDAQFEWIEVARESLPQFAMHEHLQHINSSTFLRFALETLAPDDCHRLIYLDSDVIVAKDLEGLWNVDLNGFPIGAVADVYVDPVAFADRWSLDHREAYFNAGVLLIDLEQIRADRSFSRATRFVLENSPPFADQDALNYVFWTRWLRLRPEWNAQRNMVIPSMARTIAANLQLSGVEPAIVHFMGSGKPWLPDTWHPYSWLYWANLKRTPFAKEVARDHRIGSMRLIRLRLSWWRREARRLRAAA